MLTVPKNRISGQTSPLRWQWPSLCFHRTGLTWSRMMSSLPSRHTAPWQQRPSATAPRCSSLPSLSYRKAVMSPLLQATITDPQCTDKAHSFPPKQSLAVALMWDHSWTCTALAVPWATPGSQRSPGRGLHCVPKKSCRYVNIQLYHSKTASAKC